MVVEIKNKKYNVVFGYGALRLLSKRWEVQGLTELTERLTAVFSGNSEDIQFAQIDAFCDIVIAGAQCGAGDAIIEVTTDDVGDLVMRSPQVMTEVMNSFMESMPVSKETPGKSKTATAPK